MADCKIGSGSSDLMHGIISRVSQLSKVHEGSDGYVYPLARVEAADAPMDEKRAASRREPCHGINTVDLEAAGGWLVLNCSETRPAILPCRYRGWMTL